MIENLRHRILLSIVIIGDLLVMCSAMIESGFASKAIHHNLTWDKLAPRFVGFQSIDRMDPMSTGILDGDFSAITGNDLAEILVTFIIGLLVFFVAKVITGFIFTKAGVMNEVTYGCVDLKNIFRAESGENK